MTKCQLDDYRSIQFFFLGANVMNIHWNLYKLNIIMCLLQSYFNQPLNLQLFYPAYKTFKGFEVKDFLQLHECLFVNKLQAESAMIFYCMLTFNSLKIVPLFYLTNRCTKKLFIVKRYCNAIVQHWREAPHSRSELQHARTNKLQQTERPELKKYLVLKYKDQWKFNPKLLEIQRS